MGGPHPQRRGLGAPCSAACSTATRPKPTKAGATNPWIEVNKTKQVLLYCKDGAVVWTLPVSTGSASVGIVTPSGTYKVTRKTLETSPRYLPAVYLDDAAGHPRLPERADVSGQPRVRAHPDTGTRTPSSR